MLQFAKKTEKTVSYNGSWKVLIVDDEVEVHTITKSVLKNFVYDNKNLEFVDAYSGIEAKDILAKDFSIAIVLLDVVMEKDDAGLEVARYIREDLHNNFVQIIMRTGQPGSAPEQSVIRDYEINDYKEKTELTSNKLFTVTLTSLRAYKSLIFLEKNRIGLEKIIDSIPMLFQYQDDREFAEGVLTQMEALLHFDNSSDNTFKHNGFSILHKNNGVYQIVASTGAYTNTSELSKEIKDALDKAIDSKKSYFEEDIYVGYFSVEKNSEYLIFFQGCAYLTNAEKKMIETFSSKVVIALENLLHIRKLIESNA